MVNNYNEAYKDYYDKIRRKVKVKEDKESSVHMSKEYIYPNTSNVRNYTHARGSYKVSSIKKKHKYIDGFIIRGS